MDLIQDHAEDLSGKPVPSQQERGWRFFTWAGVADKIGDTYCPQGEVEVGPDVPVAKLVCHIEDQLASRLTQAGMAPMEDLDVCFHQQKLSRLDKRLLQDDDQEWTAGSVTINVDDRIQLVLWIDADRLRSETERFIQTVCHEYCHALFVRACLMREGRPDFSEASIKRANAVLQGDIIADEALANAFAMLHDRRITLYCRDMLSYDQLLESNDEYADAYSLSCILCELVSTLKTDSDNFIYQAAHILAEDADKKLSIFDSLRLAIENDTTVNPEGLDFKTLYTRTARKYDKTSAPTCS